MIIIADLWRSLRKKPFIQQYMRLDTLSNVLMTFRDVQLYKLIAWKPNRRFHYFWQWSVLLCTVFSITYLLQTARQPRHSTNSQTNWKLTLSQKLSMSSLAVTASIAAVKDTTSSLLSIWRNSVILPTNCDFGIFFRQALRDHLVFRICSKATQKQLLTRFNIALFKVIQLALSKKAAQKDSNTQKFHTRSLQITSTREGLLSLWSCQPYLLCLRFPWSKVACLWKDWPHCVSVQKQG